MNKNLLSQTKENPPHVVSDRSGLASVRILVSTLSGNVLSLMSILSSDSLSTDSLSLTLDYKFPLVFVFGMGPCSMLKSLFILMQ